MKFLFDKWFFILFLAVLLQTLPSNSKARDLKGCYSLFKANNPNGRAVAHMCVFDQMGSNFLIGSATPTGNPAQDWEGEGVLQGNRGHYTWRFRDGKSGRTDISVDQAGNIHGKVRGAGINWDYVARRK